MEKKNKRVIILKKNLIEEEGIRLKSDAHIAFHFPVKAVMDITL